MCEYAPIFIYSPVHGQKDCFKFGALMNQNIINSHFCGHIFLFLLYKYLGIEMVDHTVSVDLNVYDASKEFFYSYQQRVRIPVAPPSCFILSLFDFSIPVGM